MIEEMRVETSNFDASQGHGTGVQHRDDDPRRARTRCAARPTTVLDQQDQLAEPAAEADVHQRPSRQGVLRGRLSSNYWRRTLGGPVVIPQADRRPQQAVLLRQLLSATTQRAGQSTPDQHGPGQREAPERRLLRPAALPNGGQYQIYDPLTARPDPARPGSVIRTPFPNNIIPRDRFMNPNGTYKNPLFGALPRMVPPPNQNFVEQGQEPIEQLLPGRDPNQVTRSTLRRPRRLQPFELRPVLLPGLGHHVLRGTTSTGPTRPSRRAARQRQDARLMVVYRQLDQGAASHWSSTRRCRPTASTRTSSGGACTATSRRDIGLPSYLDEYCQAQNNCMLPTINIGGYQGVSTPPTAACRRPTSRRRATSPASCGTHTFRGGVDYRLAMRKAGLMTAGNVSSTLQLRQRSTPAPRIPRGLSGQQRRPEPGRADARHPDVGVDRAECAASR